MHLIVSSVAVIPGLTFGVLGALARRRARRESMTPEVWRAYVAELLHRAECDGLVVVYDLDQYGGRHYRLEKGTRTWSDPFLLTVAPRKTMPLPREEEGESEPAGGGAA